MTNFYMTTTCIVGLIHDNIIYMGADSAGVNSNFQRTIRVDEKVFVKADMIFGFTSSFRMGQILRYSFSPPKQEIGEEDYTYLASRWIDALIECLKTKGFAKVHDNEVSGGFFLLGFNGKLYRIESDFQIGMGTNPYDAVGCGEPYALGALRTTENRPEGWTPKERVIHALETAEHFSAGVKGPFIIKTLPEGKP
jgi:hypothetical protein